MAMLSKKLAILWKGDRVQCSNKIKYSSIQFIKYLSKVLLNGKLVRDLIRCFCFDWTILYQQQWINCPHACWVSVQICVKFVKCVLQKWLCLYVISMKSINNSRIISRL